MKALQKLTESASRWFKARCHSVRYWDCQNCPFLPLLASFVGWDRLHCPISPCSLSPAMGERWVPLQEKSFFPAVIWFRDANGKEMQARGTATWRQQSSFLGALQSITCKAHIKEYRNSIHSNSIRIDGLRRGSYMLTTGFSWRTLSCCEQEVDGI